MTISNELRAALRDWRDWVDLGALTTLPEGTTFSNSGYVDLRSLTDEYQNYRGQRIRLKHIDGYTMLILSERARRLWLVREGRA